MIYHHKDSSCELMPIGGRAVGWFPDNPLTEVDIQLEKGDLIVYYTDGLTEAENPTGDYYGEERLLNAVMKVAGKSAIEVRDYILSDVEKFCDGQPPFDDLTMLAVRFMG